MTTQTLPSQAQASTSSARSVADSGLGFRVDTATRAHEWTSSTSTSVEHAIYRRWAEYIGGRIAETTPAPTPLWSSAEQVRTTSFDPGRQFVARFLNPRVIQITPVDSAKTIYRIATVWTGPNPIDGVIETMYATRERGEWVLLGAININTRDWVQTDFGPITYHYPRSHTFDVARAAAALVFCDSVSKLFGVPGLPKIDYYITRSGDEAVALQGIDSYKKYPGATGGYAAVGRIIVGDPSQGENYMHEFVHQILAPLTRDDKTDYLVSEGVAVWLGGTKGMTFDSARRALGAQLRAHPSVSLDSTLDPLEWNHGTIGAVLIQMAFEKGGIRAVRALFGAGKATSDDRSVFEHAFGIPWSDIKRTWKERVQAP